MVNTPLPENWLTMPTAEMIAQSIVDVILIAAKSAIESTGSFHLITAGGSTPNRCYELLSTQMADWKNWHLYMGDERCYSENHPDRNSVALTRHWLSKQNAIPKTQIHFMKTELGLTAAAEDYNPIVQNVFDTHGQFDLCLLGMGEDGHTASLFPGHFYIESQLTVMETQSPKPPKERLSLSFETLCQSTQVFKIITGASKQKAVQQWLKGDNLPIANVSGQQATYTYISQDAVAG